MDEFMTWLNNLIAEADRMTEQRPEDDWWGGYLDALQDVANKAEKLESEPARA